MLRRCIPLATLILKPQAKDYASEFSPEGLVSITSPDICNIFLENAMMPLKGCI